MNLRLEELKLTNDQTVLEHFSKVDFSSDEECTKLLCITAWIRDNLDTLQLVSRERFYQMVDHKLEEFD